MLYCKNTDSSTNIAWSVNDSLKTHFLEENGTNDVQIVIISSWVWNCSLKKRDRHLILDVDPAVWKLSVFHTGQSSARWSKRPQSFSLDSRLLVFLMSSVDSPWWVGLTCNSLFFLLSLSSCSPCVVCVIRVKAPSWRPSSVGCPFPLWERETPCWPGLS